MKYLNSETIKRIKELKAKLSEGEKQIETCASDLELAIKSYNNVVRELETFRVELVESMHDYYYNRSEKWHGSVAGNDYENWIGEWDEPFDLIMEFIDLEVPDYSVILSDRPSKPNR